MRKLSIKLIFLLLIVFSSWLVCFTVGKNVEHSMCDETYILSFRQNSRQFSESDIAAFEQEGVRLTYAGYLYPEVSSGFRKQKATVIATNENFPYFTKMDIKVGAFFNGMQEERELRVAVLNKTAAYDLFGNDNCIGEIVFLNRVSYEVIGITNEKSNTAKIYIPYQTVSVLTTDNTACNQIWCHFSNIAEASLMIGKAGFSMEDFDIQEINLFKKVFCLRFYLPLVIACIGIALFFWKKIRLNVKFLRANQVLDKKRMFDNLLQAIICLTVLIIVIRIIQIAWCIPPYYYLAEKRGMNFIYAVLDFYALARMNIDEMSFWGHWNLLSLFCLFVCFIGMLEIEKNKKENKMGYNKITDERLDEIIKSVLKDTVDHLDVSERLKEKIDKEIVNRKYKQNLGYFEQNITINLATMCLNLYESLESRVTDKALKIKCLPSDDAFEQNITISNYMYSALDVLILELVSIFGSANTEIIFCTNRNSISVKGINVLHKDLEELFKEDDRKYLIAGNRLGVTMAYLNLCDINIMVLDGYEVIIKFCD